MKITRSERVMQALLRCYPPSFRRAHGNEFRFMGWALLRVGPGNDRPTNAQQERERQQNAYDVLNRTGNVGG